MSIVVRPAVPSNVEACGRLIYDAFTGISGRHGFQPHFPTVEVAIRRGDEFRAAVFTFTGEVSELVPLVFRPGVPRRPANDLDAMGKYQEPEGCYIPSILY